MNFTKEKSRQRSKVMNDGDLVIVYERHDSLNHFYLKAGTVFNNKFGSFWHDDMIGKHYGSKIKSFCTEGYVYLLEPTPELWSIAVHVSTTLLTDSSLTNYCIIL